MLLCERITVTVSFFSAAGESGYEDSGDFGAHCPSGLAAVLAGKPFDGEPGAESGRTVKAAAPAADRNPAVPEAGPGKEACPGAKPGRIAGTGQRAAGPGAAG